MWFGIAALIVWFKITTLIGQKFDWNVRFIITQIVADICCILINHNIGIIIIVCCIVNLNISITFVVSIIKEIFGQCRSIGWEGIVVIIIIILIVIVVIYIIVVVIFVR